MTYHLITHMSMQLKNQKTSMLTFQYGTHPLQAGDLYLPDGQINGLICLLHGGFWRAPYGREQLAAMAHNLAQHGYAVWNVGYRRIGDEGGGWPGTFDDVVAGIRFLTEIKNRNLERVLDRVVLVGHSAGGQLALWTAHQLQHTASGAIHLVAAVALAPISDLIEGQKLGLGGGAIDELLRGAPPDIFSALLPLQIRQIIIHGGTDEYVPIALSQSYEKRARNLGDNIELVTLPSTGHMEFLDIASDAYNALLTGVQKIFQNA